MENTMINKPRRPWIAALLTFLVMGLGHLYAGNLRRGILLFGIGNCLVLVFTVSLDLVPPNIFLILFTLAVGIAYIVFCMSDAAAIAKSRSEIYLPVKCNHWYVYLGHIVLVGLFDIAYATMVIKPFIIQDHKIPTGSMESTLLRGDYVLVNKLIYKITTPKRGDIVVFKSPGNPESDDIKRVIGKPGDKVEIIDRTVLINGDPLQEYYVQYFKPADIRRVWGPYNVPAGHYFVLGDNRDNSWDSRFYGFVPGAHLKGKPLFVYWSYQVARDEYLEPAGGGMPKETAGYFTNLFKHARWRRIFHIIK